MKGLLVALTLVGWGGQAWATRFEPVGQIVSLDPTLPVTGSLTMSRTGDVQAAGLYSASNTGTVHYVSGTSRISFTITISGANGVTVYVDVSNFNGVTPPSVTDNTAWNTLTPNGIITQQGIGGIHGTVPINTISVAGGYRWVKLRLEGINGNTSITYGMLATQ